MCVDCSINMAYNSIIAACPRQGCGDTQRTPTAAKLCVVGTPTLITIASIHNNGCAGGGDGYQQGRRRVSVLNYSIFYTPRNIYQKLYYLE